MTSDFRKKDLNVAMSTNDTTPVTNKMSPQTTEVPSTDDGYFLYIVMAIVTGSVALIVVIIAICFIVKSRRRRQENIQRYRESQERPLSLEIIDRDSQSQEVGNGVHNSLYSQSDSILPITVYDSQGEQDRSSHQQSSIHSPEPVTNQGESDEGKGSQKSSSLQRTNTMTSSTSEKEISTSAVTTIVYENTKVSNGVFLSAMDKQKQLSMPNLNEELKSFVGMVRRHNSQKQNQLVRVDSNYETAFPYKKEKKGARSFDNVNVAIKDVENRSHNHNADSSQMGENKNARDAHITSKLTSSCTDMSDLGGKKMKPEVKPKPKTRKLFNSENIDREYMNKLQESPQHRLSAKMKRDMFKQAKSLNAVPPPCNKVTYVNVPDISTNDPAPVNSQNRTSIEKESTHNVSTKKLDNESRDYVNIPEKKHATSKSDKVISGEASEHANTPAGNKTDNADGQYMNVPEKKIIGFGSGISKADESREYVNVPDTKSSDSKCAGTAESESKDYVNIPDKKLTNVTADSKVNAKYDIPGNVLKKSDETEKLKDDLSCYVNIPENISINVIVEDTSDYEDPVCIEKLKKGNSQKDEKTLKGKQDHTKKGKIKYPKIVQHSKEAYNEIDKRKDYPWLDPKQVSTATRVRSISESPHNQDTDYMNKDAIGELRLAINRPQYKRGMSTSSLETAKSIGKRIGNWTACQKKAKEKDTSDEDEDVYLEMKNTDEDIYLHMESPDSNQYMAMKRREEGDNDIEEEEYVPMTGNNAKSISNKSKTLQHDRSEDIGFAVRTCPKPCGGASGVYNNFSENPPHYANCFRSKSTNNLNDYSYADTKPIVKLF